MAVTKIILSDLFTAEEVACLRHKIQTFDGYFKHRVRMVQQLDFPNQLLTQLPPFLLPPLRRIILSYVSQYDWLINDALPNAHILLVPVWEQVDVCGAAKELDFPTVVIGGSHQKFRHLWCFNWINDIEKWLEWKALLYVPPFQPSKSPVCSDGRCQSNTYWARKAWDLLKNGSTG